MGSAKIVSGGQVRMPTSIVMDDELIERMERVVALSEKVAWGQLRKSVIMRMAMRMGLEALELKWTQELEGRH